MTKYRYSKEQLEKAVKNSLSLAGVCRELGIRPVGGNYKTLKDYIKRENIDTSHFTGQAWNVGSRFRTFNTNKRSLKEILVEDSPHKSSNTLKQRLLKEGLKTSKCECCGNSKWQNRDIPLEVHHINGINTDNRLENLQLLCPNCHAITDNYRGKNTQGALSEKREVEYRKFRETLASNVDGNPEPSLSNKEGAETRHDKPKVVKKPKITYCKYCGKEMINSKNKYCSVECYRQDNNGKRPPVLELMKSFEIHNSYLQVGKYYGVTDQAVRKWVKFYQIESDIQQWLRYSPDYKLKRQ